MLRSTRVVMLLSIAVQMVAFVRTMIIAAELGASLDVDAYNLGTVAPTFISTVIGGWLQVAFVGKYAGFVATGKDEAAAAYRTRMLVLVASITLAMTAITVTMPGFIMTFFLPDGEHATASAAAAALRVTGLTLTPIIVGDFIGLILNSHGRFFAAAFAPLLNAAVSILVLLAWPTSGLTALVWSLLAGTLVQLAAVSVSLASMRLSFSADGQAVKGEIIATLLIALPLLPAIMLSNSAQAILQFRSAGLGEGAIAVLGYAMRLHNALGQIVVTGLGTVLLPYFASLWARGEKDEITLLLRRLTRIGIPLCAYLLGGIYLMGAPTVSVLLKRGAFDVVTANRVADIWTVLTLSLFPFALGTFIAKLCQAMRNSVIILTSGVVSFAAIWIVSLVGAREHSLPLIALATTAAWSATAVYWLLWASWILDVGRIVWDIVNSFWRSAIILTPAVLLDLLLQSKLAGVSPLAAIVLRGSTYTLITAGVMLALGFQSWFFQRIRSPSN